MLKLSASMSSLPDRSLEGCLKFGKYGPPRERCSEVDASELNHEGFPHSFTTLLEELCSDRKLFRNLGMSPSPSRHMSQQWYELYGRLGKTVNRFLLVSRVASPRQQASTH